MLFLNRIQENLPPCCEADVFEITKLTESEKNALCAHCSDIQSVIVLAHHVQHTLEWKWYPFEASRNGVISPADLHLSAEADKVIQFLEREGYNGTLLPYPGRCGVRFKDMANKTGLGKLGDNYLFLHRNWGPWTHLRVILTNAVIENGLPDCDQVCINCGKCQTVCPACAICDHDFDGMRCDAYQLSIAKEEYTNKCDLCVRACPVGLAPKELSISIAGHQSAQCD